MTSTNPSFLLRIRTVPDYPLGQAISFEVDHNRIDIDQQLASRLANTKLEHHEKEVECRDFQILQKYKKLKQNNGPFESLQDFLDFELKEQHNQFIPEI